MKCPKREVQSSASTDSVNLYMPMKRRLVTAIAACMQAEHAHVSLKNQDNRGTAASGLTKPFH